MKLAELIREIKALNGKIAQVLSNLKSENVVTWRTASAMIDELILKRHKKEIAKLPSTADENLKMISDLTKRRSYLRASLDKANAMTFVTFKGEEISLKEAIYKYSDTKSLLGTIKEMSTSQGYMYEHTHWTAQIDEKRKRKMIEAFNGEIRDLDALIQEANWKTEVRV
jgi:hypothetical protein